MTQGSRTDPADGAASLDPGEVLAGLPEGFTELYRVGRTLGRGGQGFAVQARQQKLKRDVVIKFLLVDDPSARTRFLREAELLSKIRHPNVVRLYDFGAVPAAPYLVLEYLSGSPFSSEIHHGSLDLDHVIGIAADILSGLEAIHGMGVVHRDIKPDNILLTGDGTAKLLDFGIARQEDVSSLTHAGSFVGTPAYASPEQLSGDVVDGRSDLYSFGVVLHQALTGVNPFQAPHLSEIVGNHFSLNVTRITGSRYDLPPGLENLVVALLAKSPENRPASASEALGVLERIAPVAAKRVTRNVPITAGGKATVTPVTPAGPPGPATAVTAPGTRAAAARSPARSGAVSAALAVSAPLAAPASRRAVPVAAVVTGTLVLGIAIGSWWREAPDTRAPVSASLASAVPAVDPRREFSGQIDRFHELRKTFQREFELAVKAGMDMEKLEPDDFRIPSIRPLLEIVQETPEMIRRGKSAGVGLEEWLRLEMLVGDAFGELGRPVDMVVSRQWGYGDAVLSRAASRARDCVTKITPVMDLLEAVPPPVDPIFDLFQQLLKLRIELDVANVLRAYRGTAEAPRKGSMPEWVRKYEPADGAGHAGRIAALLARFRDLPPGISTTREVLERRTILLQEGCRYAGRNSPLDSLTQDATFARRCREAQESLHAECVRLITEWFAVSPPCELTPESAISLLWRVQCLPEGMKTTGREEADRLALRILQRIPSVPEHLSFGNFRTKSDPPVRPLLDEFAARAGADVIDRMMRDRLDRIIVRGEQT